MLLAGTGRGVFRIGGDGGGAESVLASRGVRDLYRIDDAVFAGTGAGLYRSTDGGETWSDPVLADREVWQIRSGSDGVLWAGTQPVGLFRSDDGGRTWAEVESFIAVPEAERWCLPVEPPQPSRARAIVVDEADPGRLWVGVEVGGVVHTHDGGETWSVVEPGDNPDLHMLWAHPDQPATLFASTGYGRFDGVAEEVEPNAGVFRSDDAGITWSYAWHGITPRYARPMCIDHRAPYALTVAGAPTAFSSHRDEGGAGAMLFRSVDHGRSWRSLGDESHSPSAANFHGLTVDPERPGGVYVGTDTGEVWRVGDEGTWELLAAELPAVLSLAGI